MVMCYWGIKGYKSLILFVVFSIERMFLMNPNPQPLIRKETTMTNRQKLKAQTEHNFLYRVDEKVSVLVEDMKEVKAALENVATKDDIAGIATKNDIVRLENLIKGSKE